jgi:dihydroflavonol-4-reductase
MLRRDGHRVHTVSRSPRGEAAITLVRHGVTVHPGDVSDVTTLRRPMEGVDGVFHAAGWYKIGRNDVAEATATNVELKTWRQKKRG